MDMQPTTCAVCTNKSYRILYPANFRESELSPSTFSARRRPDRLHYRIIKCSSCGLVRSNPILPETRLNQFYRASTISYTNEISNLQQTYGRYLRQILTQVPNRQRFLEIGCGNGFFLETAADLGFKQIYGVEPSLAAVTQAKPDIKRGIVNAIFSAKLFPENYFDLICCFHTLDHVPDPNRFLKNVFQVLKPGASVFFITHNVESILAKLLKSACPIIDIQHIYLFNPDTLTQIFRKNKFQVLKTFSIRNTYSLRYFLSMLPVSLRFNIPFDSQVSLTLPLGNLAIVARK